MDHDHHHAAPDTPAGTETAKDPVCGMTVTVKPDGRHAEIQSETFHFCSEKCQTKFKADPWFYASGRAAGQKKAAPANVQYTCPMHPEIVRDAPGSCPICGMALEPMVPSDEPSEELTDFTRRMWISAAAAVPLIVLTMGELVALPVRDWIGHQTASYLEFVLATPIILWAALPFFRRGWDSIVNRSPNMWTLISIGVAAAYLYSIVATFLPGLFPEQYRMGHGVGTYFEAAVVIVALVFVGQVLELRARERTGDAIRALLDLAPKTARRILPDGTEYDAPLENIMEGDRLTDMCNNAAPHAPAKAISSVPIWRAFIETYGLRRAVFLEGLVGPSGSDPPQRGIVSLLSGRRPGSRLSPGVSDKSLPRPKPVAACVSPEDPPRSKPGRSIFFPLSSTA